MCLQALLQLLLSKVKLNMRARSPELLQTHICGHRQNTHTEQLPKHVHTWHSSLFPCQHMICWHFQNENRVTGGHREDYSNSTQAWQNKGWTHYSTAGFELTFIFQTRGNQPAAISLTDLISKCYIHTQVIDGSMNLSHPWKLPLHKRCRKSYLDDVKKIRFFREPKIVLL